MFTWPVRVYYEDTDLGGVVYYANYLKFLERARTEWLRSLGIDQSALLAGSRLIFVIVRAELAYLSPARFDDLLCVTATLAARRRTTMTFDQAIHRGDVEGPRLVTGTVEAACVDADSFRPRPIPNDILAAMERAS
jgi:acyl-CoA thioester hydrolase